MKSKILTGAIATLCAACAQASTLVENFNDGKAKAGEDGFVVVFYPEGWNAKYEALGKAILDSPELKKAAGNAMLMGVGIPNLDSKEMKEARKRKLGPISVPGGAVSYPCISMCEAGGRSYATISSNEFCEPGVSSKSFSSAAVAKASQEVAARLKAIKKQRSLMQQAAPASGKQKIDLIAQACNIPGISRPDKVVDMVKKADPKDEFGLTTALTFNWYGLVERCGNAKAEEWEARYAEVEKHLKNPYFAPHVRQPIYSAAIGLLRRHGGQPKREKMLAYLDEMKAVDPKSRYGLSTVGALRLWDFWSCEWKPAMIPQTNGPMEIAAPCFRGPGTYVVTLDYKKGAHAMQASGIELYDGATKVAEDVHECFSGTRKNGHVFRLTVSKKVANPRLIINTKMGKNRDSSGVITVRQE